MRGKCIKYIYKDTPTAGNEQEEGASTSKSDTLVDIVRAMSSDDNDDDAKRLENDVFSVHFQFSGC
jgi:uncharacterized protein (DUF2267 family)